MPWAFGSKLGLRVGRSILNKAIRIESSAAAGRVKGRLHRAIGEMGSLTRLLTALILCALPFSGGLASCALFGPPGWVHQPPSDSTYYYAIGSAGPQYNGSRANAIRIARERALAELAGQVRVRVASTSTLSDRGGGSEYVSESVQLSDEVLQDVETVGSWYDERGRAGSPGHTWVLVRVARAIVSPSIQ